MIRRLIGTAITLCAVMLSAALPATVLAGEATPVAPADLDPARFSPVVSNPFFPLASVRIKVYEGKFTDEETGETVVERVEEVVLPDTVMIAGIEATVIEVHEYAGGELTERTLDYYAQADDGTVYYLGEDVDMYEDGEIVSHEGAWRTGESDNLAGVFMPAEPAVEMTFEQERAPGVAEDRSTVIAIGETVTVPAGTFAGCMRTEDINPLDDATEFKLYCPGIGVVREEDDEGTLELLSFEGGMTNT